MTLRKPKMVIWGMLFMLSFALAACGGRMYHTKVENGVKSVYYKDENGQQKVVYQINQDGSVTVYDEDDVMYQNYVAQQKWNKIATEYKADLDRKKAEREKRLAEAHLERIQAIRDAKKRRSSAPIYVSVHMPTIESKKADSAQRTAQRIHQAVCEQLDADRILRVTKQKADKADVEVFPKVYFKQEVGYSKKTKKLVPMYVFYFEFNVRSNYLPEDNYTFEEHGHWIYNQKIVADGTERISKIIKKMIGPNIPAERYKYLNYGTSKLLGELGEGHSTK